MKICIWGGIAVLTVAFLSGRSFETVSPEPVVSAPIRHTEAPVALAVNNNEVVIVATGFDLELQN